METSVSQARWILIPLFFFYAAVVAASSALTWSEQEKQTVSNADPRVAVGSGLMDRASLKVDDCTMPARQRRQFALLVASSTIATPGPFAIPASAPYDRWNVTNLSITLAISRFD
jgi:hypothetical protein